jgi:hypothetical protein
MLPRGGERANLVQIRSSAGVFEDLVRLPPRDRLTARQFSNVASGVKEKTIIFQIILDDN